MKLPDHVFGADEEELSRLRDCVDVARLMEARHTAKQAAVEAWTAGEADFSGAKEIGSPRTGD
jgi:hypothetical protein